MAIWPFGRKGKRPRSQMKASDAADRRLSFEDATDKSSAAERALVARKPSRKRSKREKQRSAAASLRHPSPIPRAGAGEPARQLSFSYHHDNHTSFSSIGQDHITVTRTIPVLQKRDSTRNKANTLKKRLSKRSAQEVQREREIKALSSSPPSGHPPNTWGYLASDVRRGPSVRSRYADHHTSNQSLPMGSQSSLSDSSDLYAYKVNALAVLTPRPIIRYAEIHNTKSVAPRSTNPSSNSMRRDLNLGDEDDRHSRKRIAELADDLDASALRELLERDRRRREKKHLKDQERRQRRLQRRLEREQEQEQEHHQAEHVDGLGVTSHADEIDMDELRGRDKTPSPATSATSYCPETAMDEPQLQTQQKEQQCVYSPAQSGSWLREPSEHSQQGDKRFSDLSAHVIGNIDDRSIRADKQAHDANAMSEEDISRHHRSPLFLAVANTSSAHMSSVAQESISDLSRTENSEKRLSDTSSRRMSSWIAFFRRASLRRRSSRETDAPPSEFSNTSRDSFMRAQAQAHAHAHAQAQAQARGASPANMPSMPIPIPERGFRRTGTVYRSQSKFVEHLGDYPISPPDSRMQSPLPVPLEPVTDIPAEDEANAGPSPRQSFADGDDYNYENDDGRSRPMSWDEKSGMLSQSLASIDSEGSWMSGKYLKRVSQQNPGIFTSWRNSTGKNKLDKYDEAEEHDEVVNDEYLNQLAEESPEEILSNTAPGVRRPSSTAMGLDITEVESEGSRRSSTVMGALETWHTGLERKPTVVRRESGQIHDALSKEVVFGDADMLDALSVAEEDNISPISPISRDGEPEIKHATSVNYGREHGHARQMSAGSAKLLEIAPRVSVDSSST